MAVLYHSHLIQLLRGGSALEMVYLFLRLPTDVVSCLARIDRQSKEQDNYSQTVWRCMWDFVEKAAELNWMTPFMCAITKQALVTGFYTPKSKLRRLYNKRLAQFEEYFDSIQSKLTNKCSNPICTLKLASDVTMMRCGNCLAEQYCSKECQMIHWNKTHKKECVKHSDTASGIFLM